MAYQIAFDMYESAPQQFLWRVIEALRVTAPVPSAAYHIVTVPVEVSADVAVRTSNSMSTDTLPSSAPSAAAIDEDVEKRVENLVIIIAQDVIIL